MFCFVLFSVISSLILKVRIKITLGYYKEARLNTYGNAQSIYTKKCQCSAYISNLHTQGLCGQVLTIQGAVFFFFFFMN